MKIGGAMEIAEALLRVAGGVKDIVGKRAEKPDPADLTNAISALADRCTALETENRSLRAQIRALGGTPT